MVHFVEVYVEENGLCPEGCTLRFRAKGEARPVRTVRYPAGPGELQTDGRQRPWRPILSSPLDPDERRR